MNNGRRSFGDIIRKARGEAKLTQQALADLLNVRQSTVSAWEMEVARPKTAVLVRLSGVLHLDLSMITEAAAEPVAARA
jgi:transcriptional regulator with XRE-family HTH domain